MKSLFFLLASIVVSVVAIGIVGRFVSHLISNAIWLGLFALVALIVYNKLSGKSDRRSVA